MEDTATPETGPVDAPVSIESIAAEIEAGGEAPADVLDDVTQELVNEAEGEGEAEQAPETEDDATEAEVEAEEPEEGTPDEQTFTVKVNGEEREVPLTELLNGYSRTEDYKAKTAAVAEARRQAERSIAEAKATYANQLEEATNLFARFDPVLAEAERIDWATLKATDPAAFVQAQDAVQARLTAIQQMKAQAEQHRGETQQHQKAEQDRERAERFDRAADEIVKAIPELADEAKFREFAGEAIGFLRGEGFEQAEIADVLDHRVLKLVDKARKWEAHEAAQKSLPEKRVVQRSVVKPLKTDGSSSRATPRFPANANGERKVDWIAQQILSEA